MKQGLTFDDVLIRPRFSTVNSRKDVDLNTGYSRLPIISSNMDTITGPEMAKAMLAEGGLACLHRFWSIAENVAAFRNSCFEGRSPWVSVGVGGTEFDRAKALYDVGARILVLDVAHGSQKQVADQYIRLEETLPGVTFVIGNFATSNSILDFIDACGYRYVPDFPGIIKVGIGPGSSCSTRVKTGIGVPQLSAIIDCASLGLPIIADGGMKTSGDVAKALAGGASLVMLGGMLAGTAETPGLPIYDSVVDEWDKIPTRKQYRGSASKESYDVQGKDWACAEGESFSVPYKGPVAKVLADIEGGLRSALSYVGAKDIFEFQRRAEFIRVTNAGVIESGAHGKKG